MSEGGTLKLFNYSFPTDIIYGENAIANIKNYLDKNFHRVLIVTDRGLADSQILKSLGNNLSQSNINFEIFSDFQGNPQESHVNAGLEVYREFNANSLIAFGGGAAIDVCKAIGVLANHDGELFDYAISKSDLERREISNNFPYFIAIPTTAGTGSEVGRSAVISDNKTHKKEIIFTPKMMPSHVILDPVLHVGLPAHITAATGMDALTHHLEAYLALGYNPMCDGIALQGIEMIAQNLENAVNNPTNLESRGAMINASMMGAVAFQKGLGVVHSCAHALSTVCDLHHGLANALMLEVCMEFNQEVVPEKFEKLDQILKQDFFAWLEDLKQKIKIPEKLDVKSSDLEMLVNTAFADGCHLENCREVTKADFESLYKAAL